MTAEDTTKVIRIVIDSSKAVDGGRAAQRALDQIEKQTGTMSMAMERAMGSMDRVVGSLARLGALFGVGFSAKAIVDAADAFTRFNNALTVAGTRAMDLADVQERLFAAANRNGVEIGALSTLYSRASIAGNELGATQDKLLKFVDGVTAALRVQGGSTQEASGALLQLSQSLGSGIVRAEEFNSILEGAFPVAQAAARGIEGMNGSVSKLRTAVAAGQITSQKFFEGLLKGFSETEKQAASMNLTVSAALTVLQNGFIRFVGEVDKASGATSGLASAIAELGRSLDDLSKDKMAMADFTALWAEKFASTRREIERLDELMKSAQRALAEQQPDTWWTRLGDTLREATYNFAASIARWNAYLIEGFKGLPGFIGGIFTAAMNSALAAVETGVNKIVAMLNGFRGEHPRVASRILGFDSDISPVNLGRLVGGTGYDQYRANILAAGDAAAGQVREAQYAAEQERPESAARDQRIEAEQQEARARRIPLPISEPSQQRLSPTTPTAKATSAEKSYDKLIEQLKAAADAQDQMTNAAIRGDVAFQAQTIHAQAVEKAIGLFGKALSDTDPRLRKIEELIGHATFGKLAENFAKATNELDNQNEVLEAQLRLMNEAPEIQAREIALIKVKQEVEKAGGKITDDEINRRKAAIEQNETLKAQAEQMKQANELWLEPLRQGLRNIQTAGADAWETILETGNFTFKSLADVFTRTLRRMAAEFLALATIRPVMSVAVDVIGPGGLGIIGGNSAAQLGFPVGGAGGSGLGSVFGGGSTGGGLGSMFSSGGSSGTGWLARQFSGVGDWLASPVSSMFGASATPAGGFANVGDLLASGQTSASAAATGGLSIGSAIGGIGSIGSGVYTLATGGGSTSSMVSGIGQTIGGIVTMLPIPGAQIIGPLISLGSTLLGGLLGDGGPKIPPMPGLNYQTGTVDDSVTQLIARTGGRGIAGQLYGGSWGSGDTHTWDGSQWVAQHYTQGYLNAPDGTVSMIGGTGQNTTDQQAAEALTAQMFRADVLNRAISGVSDTLVKVFTNLNTYSVKATEEAIDFATAYDKLGKAANPAKDAIAQINFTLDDLATKAGTYGMSLDPINAEREKQSKRSAQDFIDAMLDPLAVQMRALDDAKDQALASAEYIRDNIEGVNVDINRIVDYYGKQRVALEDQYYGGAITNLKNLIDRATYGDLANASPTLQLAGTKSAYEAVLVGARANDPTSITSYAGLAESYLNVARQNFASSPEYEAIRQEILKAATELQATVTGGAATGAGSAQEINQAVQVQMAANDQLREIAQTQSEQIEDLKNMVATLVAQQRSLITNRM